MPESAHVDVVLAVDREGLWGRRAVPRDLDLFSGRHTVEHVTRHLCRGHPHHRRSVSGEIRPSALAPSQHLGEGARGEAFGLADALRVRGVPTVIAVGGRSMKAQLRQANGSGARWAVVIGDDELSRGVVQLKDMQDGGASEEISSVALVDRLAGG